MESIVKIEIFNQYFASAFYSKFGSILCTYP